MANHCKVPDILNAAADLLMRTGWCQGVGHAFAGGHRYCAIGAIGQARYDMGCDAAVATAATQRLANAVGVHVAVWNDDHCTRRAQVVAKLREVAAEVAAEAISHV